MKKHSPLTLTSDQLRHLDSLLACNESADGKNLQMSESIMAACPCGNTCSGDPTNVCECSGWLTFG